MGQAVKIKDDRALRSFLWSVIFALLALIAWLIFAYQRPGAVHTVLAPMVDKVDSMISKLPALPSVTLTEPTSILFMGVDVSYSGQRRHLKIDKTSLKGNSDTMMLGFLNPPLQKASVLNIPRDTEAYVGNYGIQKINSANCLGGPELARSTVSGLLNVPVHHYLVLNLQGFVQMVNELGGITVEVPKKMSYMDWTAKLKIDLEPGVHTLTGNQAMGFVRFRHDALGDIGRVQRQQLFLQAVARKMADPRSWVHVPALLEIAQNNIESDMNQLDIIAVLNYVHSLPKENIKFVMLPGQFSPNGDWIATTDGRELAQQMANPGYEYPSSRRNITVCVVNASSDHSFGSKVSDALRKLGYVTFVAPDDPDIAHKNTQIIAQNGNTANAKMLQQDLGGKGSVVNASVGSLIGSITVMAHDDLNLDNIKMSSADAPYVAQVAMPAPIVARPPDSGKSKRANKNAAEETATQAGEQDSLDATPEASQTNLMPVEPERNLQAEGSQSFVDGQQEEMRGRGGLGSESAPLPGSSESAAGSAEQGRRYYSSTDTGSRRSALSESGRSSSAQEPGRYSGGGFEAGRSSAAPEPGRASGSTEFGRRSSSSLESARQHQNELSQPSAAKPVNVEPPAEPAPELLRE